MPLLYYYFFFFYKCLAEPIRLRGHTHVPHMQRTILGAGVASTAKIKGAINMGQEGEAKLVSA